MEQKTALEPHVAEVAAHVRLAELAQLVAVVVVKVHLGLEFILVGKHVLTAFKIEYLHGILSLSQQVSDLIELRLT